MFEKLWEFQDYYNTHQVHQAVNLKTPEEIAWKELPTQANLEIYA